MALFLEFIFGIPGSRKNSLHRNKKCFFKSDTTSQEYDVEINFTKQSLDEVSL